MKKVLSLLSVTLSLVLIAATIFVVPTFAASGSTVGENLLENPEFVTDDTGAITNWSYSDQATIHQDSEGETYLRFSTTTTNSRLSLSSTKQLSIDPTKYYEFSVDYRLTDPIEGDFNINNGVYLTFKYNGSFINKEYFTKNSEWTKGSFILYGGEVTSTAWDRHFSVVSNYSRCVVDIKNPCVRVVDPDSLNYNDDIVGENLLSNGDFSKYDSSIAVTDTSKTRFTDFSIAGRTSSPAVCVNHEQVTVEINGKTTTAAKLTYDGTSYDQRDALFKNVHKVISTNKYYEISTWIKVTASSYDNTFEVGYDGFLKFGCDKNNGNAQVIKSDPISAECDWQQINLIVNGADWDNDNWDSRIGIWIYRMNCDVYLADMRVEEFVGDISVAKNIENGSIEANRNNANANDLVEVKAVANEGYALTKLYYTDGTTETTISNKRTAVINESSVTDSFDGTHNANTYEIMPSNVIYTFSMPANTDITVSAVFEKYLLGDINADESVDIRDLVRLALYLGDDTTVIATVNADIDGNGTIETADITALREILLNQ